MDQLVSIALFLQATLFQFASPLPQVAITSATVLNTSNPITTSSNSINFQSAEMLEDSIQHLYQAIKLNEFDLSFEVFKYAMVGYYNLREAGRLNDKNLVSIIDFTKSSRQKRFYTIDLSKLAVKFHTYVSHGKNTGEDLAQAFSNVLHSNQSSIGFYVTGETYVGSKGYSLKLDGVEKGYNDNLRARAVVMHNAEYVSESWIKKYGRLGRSQGCPALPVDIGKRVIETLKNKTAIFAYFDDANYLTSSPFLNPSTLFSDYTASAQ